MMNKPYSKTFLFGISILFFYFLRVPCAYADASLSLDSNLKSTTKDATIDIQLNIAPGGAQIFGSDVKIHYPKMDVELLSVDNGGFFDNIVYANDADVGNVDIHGYFNSSAQGSKTTDGTIGILHFKQINSSINNTLAFVCDKNSNVTQIIDVTGNNIFSCSNLRDPVMTNAQSKTTTAAGANHNMWIFLATGVVVVAIIGLVIWLIIKRKKQQVNFFQQTIDTPSSDNDPSVTQNINTSRPTVPLADPPMPPQDNTIPPLTNQ